MPDQEKDIKSIINNALSAQTASVNGVDEVAGSRVTVDSDLDLDRAAAEIIRRTPYPPVWKNDSIGDPISSMMEHQTRMSAWEDSLRDDCIKTHGDLTQASIEGEGQAIIWTATALYSKVRQRMLDNVGMMQDAVKNQQLREDQIFKLKRKAGQNGFDATDVDQLLQTHTVQQVDHQIERALDEDQQRRARAGGIICRGLCAIGCGMLVVDRKFKQKDASWGATDAVLITGAAVAGWFAGGFIYQQKAAIEAGLGGLSVGRRLLKGAS